jgi:hypothetical protein
MATTAHGTLAANEVTSVAIESGRGGIVIVNRAQTGTIWVRLDGVDPEPEGSGTFAVYGAREFPAQQRTRQIINVEVRMISDTAVQYSVEAY